MILDLQTEEVKKKLGYYNKPDKLCEFLRKKRREKGYTLREFSKEIGVSAKEYSSLENNRLSPDVFEMYAIAQVLDIDFAMLAGAFISRVFEEEIVIKE